MYYFSKNHNKTNSDNRKNSHICYITVVLSADETLQQIRSGDKQKQVFGSRTGVHVSDKYYRDYRV